MKKIGRVTVVTFLFRPSIYTYDEIRMQRFINNDANKDQYLQVLAWFGKESADIKNIRAVTAQNGTPTAKAEYDMAVAMENAIRALYFEAMQLEEIPKHLIGQDLQIMVSNSLVIGE